MTASKVDDSEQNPKPKSALDPLPQRAKCMARHSDSTSSLFAAATAQAPTAELLELRSLSEIFSPAAPSLPAAVPGTASSSRSSLQALRFASISVRPARGGETRLFQRGRLAAIRRIRCRCRCRPAPSAASRRIGKAAPAQNQELHQTAPIICTPGPSRKPDRLKSRSSKKKSSAGNRPKPAKTQNVDDAAVGGHDPI